MSSIEDYAFISFNCHDNSAREIDSSIISILSLGKLKLKRLRNLSRIIQQFIKRTGNPPSLPDSNCRELTLPS